MDDKNVFGFDDVIRKLIDGIDKDNCTDGRILLANYTSALRGCDIGLDHHKDLFTAFLRGNTHIGIHWRDLKHRLYHSDDGIKEEIIKEIKMIQDSNNGKNRVAYLHYVDHLKLGFESLQSLGYFHTPWMQALFQSLKRPIYDHPIKLAEDTNLTADIEKQLQWYLDFVRKYLSQ